MRPTKSGILQNGNKETHAIGTRRGKRFPKRGWIFQTMALVPFVLICTFCKLMQLPLSTEPSAESVSKITRQMRRWNGHEIVLASQKAGSCPCMAFNHLIPRGLPYSYEVFHTVAELEHMIEQAPKKRHFLVVARSDIASINNMVGEVIKKKSKEMEIENIFPTSVGLLHLADEFLDQTVYNDKNTSSHFDYVLRHYYQSGSVRIPKLRALGNHSCGVSPSLPEKDPRLPKWGIHWTLLWATEKVDFGFRHMPLQARTTNCTFLGRPTPERQQLMDVFRQGNTLDGRAPCKIDFTEGFAKGLKGLDYVNYISRSKIILNPPGNNVECLRFGECLHLGTVVATLDSEYLHSLWRPMPVIIGQTWADVRSKVMEILDDEARGGKQLLELHSSIPLWVQDFFECTQRDMAFILSSAFGIMGG